MNNPNQYPNQQPYQQQSYYQPNYVQGQQPPMKPNNHLAGAILSTIFCCLPLGIVAIIYASKVDGLYRAGDYFGAQDASNKAMNYTLWGVVLGIICIIIGFFAGGL